MSPSSTALSANICLSCPILTLLFTAASEVQVALASARISTLKETGDSNTNKKVKLEFTRELSYIDAQCLHPKMIALLEQYVSHLKAPGHKGGQHMSHQYEIPSDLLSPEERVEFDNVYQIHCPKIVIDSAIRDVSQQFLGDSAQCARSDHDPILLQFSCSKRSGVPYG